MEAADKDGDGAISMDEFIEWGMSISGQMQGDHIPDELMKFFKLNWRNTDQNGQLAFGEPEACLLCHNT